MYHTTERYKEAWTRYPKVVLARLSASEVGKIERGCQDLSPIYSRNIFRLHEFPNVVGVGVSLKVKNFEVRPIPCIVVFVREKIPADRLRPYEQIPPTIDGAPTDVVESGVPELRTYHFRIDPAQPGYSIGHKAITAGTFGCLVRDRKTGETLILSNNHVLANSNNCQIGDPIVQPGPADGGRDPHDTLATLVRFVPIVAGNNRVDAAVARPIPPRKVTPNITGVGKPTGWREITSVGEEVQKVGRTTQHTTGIITAYNATIFPLYYPGVGNATFIESIVTTGMSRGGDSGSLLLDMERRAVGLLFAGMSLNGREIVTYYNDITNVFSLLNVDLVTS